ncbi:MAG: four helix bundle protein [bacterium]|nr:four helix bundle protein [bacterium]
MQVEDLEVYQRLCDLSLEVHELTMSFPKFELYELGSQLRRSSNSPAANLAESFGSKHTNIYTETISRTQGEIRETKHHLRMARKKDYLNEERLNYFITEFERCSKMLYRLAQFLDRSKKPKS